MTPARRIYPGQLDRMSPNTNTARGKSGVPLKKKLQKVDGDDELNPALKVAPMVFSG